MKENYKILGTSENATIEEIEEAYKKLEKKYKGNNNKTAKTKLNEIRKAYEELTKVKKAKFKEDNQEESLEPIEGSTLLDKITKERMITFGIGLVLGLIIMMFFFPDRIAELENGEQVAVEVGKTNITSDDIYNRMKKATALNVVVEKVDQAILYKKYELTEEDEKTISENANKYLTEATQYYGLSEEDFLKSSGFDTKEEYIKNVIELDYLRSKYFKDYVYGMITDDEVNDYYNSKVYGTISTEHILVKNDTMSDEEASSKATEILDKLKNGASWEDLKNEYKNVIITENVNVEFDSNLESSYKMEAEKLSDGSYSSSLVKTSYGYHIIYRKSTTEKQSLKEVTTRIKNILSEVKQEEDSNLYAKTLIEMRKEAGMDIKDTEIKSIYDYYVSTIEKANN